MRDAVEIQREAMDVEKQIAEANLDIQKLRTKKAELEVEFLDVQKAAFENQVTTQQAK